MSTCKRRAVGKPTSECMIDFYHSRFEGHKQDDASQLDVLFWMDYLGKHQSVPKRYRITPSALLRYFKTGTITCSYYVFLIRAALDHYYSVLEVNKLPSCVKFLAMHIFEDREVITLRDAAEHLGMLPHQLVQILNGHQAINQQLEMAISDLVSRISSDNDKIIRGYFSETERDYLDWDPKDPQFYSEKDDEGSES